MGAVRQAVASGLALMLMDSAERASGQIDAIPIMYRKNTPYPTSTALGCADNLLGTKDTAKFSEIQRWIRAPELVMAVLTVVVLLLFVLS